MLPMGHKTGEHEVSIVWLAETGKTHSTRQITSGKYNDCDPKWCPDGQFIAFLSNCQKPGESCAICTMPINVGGEPLPLMPAEQEKKIENFEFSPEGKTIAFISADEKTEEKKKKREK